MEQMRPRFINLQSKSLTNIRVLCGIALFCAVFLILRSFTINLTPSLRITFTFLATAASCYFFGLVPNVIAAFVCDLLGFLIHPDGTYIPLYALGPMLTAMLFSMSFYGREKIGWIRVAVVKLVQTVLVNLILNPLVLSLLLQTPFWVLFTTRLMKNVLLFPVEVILLYIVLQFCIRIRKRINWL